MRITEDVRAYAARQAMVPEDALERGLAEKAEEFRRAGGEIYRAP